MNKYLVYLMGLLLGLVAIACSSGDDDDIDISTDSATDTGSDTSSDGQVTGDPCGVANPFSCSPATATTCGADTSVACDFVEYQATGIHDFNCEPGSTAAMGETCGWLAGPYCLAGMTCWTDQQGADTGTCAKWCCGNADCDAGYVCDTTYADGLNVAAEAVVITGGNLGVCIEGMPDGGMDAGK
ncbi:MAG: hypothetical protein QNJ97_01435 [Myxococcota bacterium]|nr:hypothetical protein [Myxococcota bacterium]